MAPSLTQLADKPEIASEDIAKLTCMISKRNITTMLDSGPSVLCLLAYIRHFGTVG